MNDLTKQLKCFKNRVRIVRSWRGLAMGACIGAGTCAVWAFLDWRSVVYTEWSWMGGLTVGFALIGGILGFGQKIPIEKLAESIDRRAGLEDRLTTANERADKGDIFDLALQSDAERKLAVLRPRNIYPIRFGKWQAGAFALTALAAAIFVLGNTPIGLNEDAKKDREELKKESESVKRVTKQNFESPEAKEEMSDAEKKLADQLRRFDRDLEKAHMSKEDALQKSNELSQKADELMQQAANTSQQSLSQAQTALGEMEKAEMAKGGMSGFNPEMAQMSDGQREQQMAQAKSQAKQLQQELEALKKKLEEINRKLANSQLSAAERKALEEQKAALEKQISKLASDIQENKDLQKALELSKEAQEIFNRMAKDPLFKEMLEIQKKLAQNSDAASKSGQPKMTDAERAAIKKQLEELAAKLKDAKAMKEYLEALLKAMKEANRLGRLNGIGLGLMGLQIPGLSPAPAGPGDTTPGIWTGDTGKIHKLNKPEASRGSTTTDVISGDPRMSNGPQQYVEIRAPSTVGNRTSVPYREVLPSYQKKAESALNRQEIPKEHQKRVKEYFDSLTGAGKH